MDNIKNYFDNLKKCDEKIKRLEKQLEKAKEEKTKKHKDCDHDLIFVLKKSEIDVKELTAIYGKCLICGKDMNFSNYYVKDFKTYQFQDYENKAGFVDINTLIDATSMVPARTLELYNCGDYCSAVRARVKFLTLLNSDQKLSKEEVKQLILEDAIKYDQELYDNFPEYTEEEIRIAMQPDDNMEIINAINEECVDLCSGDVKRKIK